MARQPRDPTDSGGPTLKGLSQQMHKTHHRIMPDPGSALWLIFADETEVARLKEWSEATMRQAGDREKAWNKDAESTFNSMEAKPKLVLG